MIFTASASTTSPGDLAVPVSVTRRRLTMPRGPAAGWFTGSVRATAGSRRRRPTRPGTERLALDLFEDLMRVVTVHAGQQDLQLGLVAEMRGCAQ
jgi:hypothetical protein